MRLEVASLSIRGVISTGRGTPHRCLFRDPPKSRFMHRRSLSHMLSSFFCWVQPVERVRKKLIMAECLVITFCEMRRKGSRSPSRPIIETRRQAGASCHCRGSEDIDLVCGTRGTENTNMDAKSSHCDSYHDQYPKPECLLLLINKS